MVVGPSGSGTQQDMTDEELERRILAVIRDLRPLSRWAVEQWLRLLEVEPVPGVLMLEKPTRLGDPVEATFHGNYTVDTRDRYERRTAKR